MDFSQTISDLEAAAAAAVKKVSIAKLIGPLVEQLDPSLESEVNAFISGSGWSLVYTPPVAAEGSPNE